MRGENPRLPTPPHADHADHADHCCCATIVAATSGDRVDMVRVVDMAQTGPIPTRGRYLHGADTYTRPIPTRGRYLPPHPAAVHTPVLCVSAGVRVRARYGAPYCRVCRVRKRMVRCSCAVRVRVRVKV